MRFFSFLFSLAILMASCDTPGEQSSAASSQPVDTAQAVDTVGENLRTTTRNNVEYVIVQDDNGLEQAVEMAIYMNMIQNYGSNARSHYSSYAEPYRPNQYTTPHVQHVVHHYSYPANAGSSSGAPSVAPAYHAKPAPANPIGYKPVSSKPDPDVKRSPTPSATPAVPSRRNQVDAESKTYTPVYQQHSTPPASAKPASSSGSGYKPSSTAPKPSSPSSRGNGVPAKSSTSHPSYSKPASRSHSTTHHSTSHSHSGGHH